MGGEPQLNICACLRSLKKDAQLKQGVLLECLFTG
jgi:hypothetical protein